MLKDTLNLDKGSDKWPCYTQLQGQLPSKLAKTHFFGSLIDKLSEMQSHR